MMNVSSDSCHLPMLSVFNATCPSYFLCCFCFVLCIFFLRLRLCIFEFNQTRHKQQFSLHTHSLTHSTLCSHSLIRWFSYLFSASLEFFSRVWSHQSALWNRKMFSFFIRKGVRKILKRKDSDAGEKGCFFISSIFLSLWVFLTLTFLPICVWGAFWTILSNGTWLDGTLLTVFLCFGND